MSRRARLWAAATCLCVTAGFGGCASLPTSGSVAAGNSGEQAANPLDFIAPGPAASDSPVEIVEGFLRAVAENHRGYEKARSFLAGAMSRQWSPEAHMSVIEDDDLEVTFLGMEPTQLKSRGEEAVVSLTASQIASVSNTGVLTVTPNERASFEYRLRQVSGEWRIAKLPDGVVVTRSLFELSYAPYDLHFYSVVNGRVVADPRWFARRESVATTLAKELAAGPADYLARGVTSALPPTVALAPPGAVRASDGVAYVNLTSPFGQLDRVAQVQAFQQYSLTLQQVPQVRSVQLAVGGNNVRMPNSAVESSTLERPPIYTVEEGKIWERPSLQSSQRVAVQTPDLTVLGDFTIAVQPESPDPRIVARNQDGSQLVLLGEEPTVLADDDGTYSEPTVDAAGWTWTVHTGEGTRLLSISPSGEVLPVELRLPPSEVLQEVRMSVDGVRLLMLTSREDGRNQVRVQAIPRASRGNPHGAGSIPPHLVWASYATVQDYDWDSPSSFVVLRGPEPLEIANSSPLSAASGAKELSVDRLSSAGWPLVKTSGPPGMSGMVTSEAGELIVRTAADRYLRRDGPVWVAVDELADVDQVLYPG